MALTLDAIRAELPVTQRAAYLNSGTAGPLPRRSHEALVAEARRQLEEGRILFSVYWNDYFPMMDDLRARFARLLGASAGEIALTHNTTEGMNISVWGLPWQPGDEVITTSTEHEGGLLPVYAAARRFGLVARVVDVTGGGDMVERIERALTPRTRLVVLSHVSFKSGEILPVAEIARAAHRAGALVAVDGAQSAGVIPVDVNALDVDFYAVPGQKWLLGPEGAGALYVRRERLADLYPTFVGFFSLRDYEATDLTGYYIPASNAKRYEGSSVYWPALFAMRESLRWLEEEVGFEFVYEQGARISRRCREMLAGTPGVRLLSPATMSGLTTFSIEGQSDAMPIVEALAEQGVYIRSLHAPGHLRVSTGFFNSEADLERLVEGLAPWTRR